MAEHAKKLAEEAKKLAAQIEHRATEANNILKYQGKFGSAGMYQLVSLNLKVSELEPYYKMLQAVHYNDGGIVLHYHHDKVELGNGRLAELLGMPRASDAFSLELPDKQMTPEQARLFLGVKDAETLKALTCNDKISYEKIEDEELRCFFEQVVKRLMTLKGYHHMNTHRLTIARQVLRGELHALAVFKAGLVRGQKTRALPGYPTLHGYHLAYVVKLQQEILGVPECRLQPAASVVKPKTKEVVSVQNKDPSRGSSEIKMPTVEVVKEAGRETSGEIKMPTVEVAKEAVTVVKRGTVEVSTLTTPAQRQDFLLRAYPSGKLKRRDYLAEIEVHIFTVAVADRHSSTGEVTHSFG